MRTLEDAFLNTDTSSQMKQTTIALAEEEIMVMIIVRITLMMMWLFDQSRVRTRLSGACRRLRESLSCLHMLEGGTHTQRCYVCLANRLPDSATVMLMRVSAGLRDKHDSRLC